MAAVGASALVLAGGAAVLGNGFVDDPPAKPKATQQQQDGLLPFEDTRDKLSISYPASWSRIASSDPEIALLAGSSEASMSLRTSSLGTNIGPKNLDSAKKLTDKLVMRGSHVTQLRPPRRIDNLGGLPGWLYIYSFEKGGGKQRGAHAHYFLFRGPTMITLVFQTLPSERFATYAPLFDRLAGTFKTLSSDPGSGQSSG